MKKSNKKGFTIVELVIVIAVIAILAAVLIPTFTNVVEKANESACLQEARNNYTDIYARDISDGVIDGKEDGVDMSVADYSVDASGNITYSYTKNGYKATYNSTTSKWTVEKETSGN